jgi:ribosomal protein L11 methyltransferase
LALSWNEVSISLRREQAALAELVLQQQGALAVTLEDDADHPVLEPGPGSTPLWPTVQLRGLFPEQHSRETIMSALMMIEAVDRPGQLRWRVILDQAWERAWMDRFHPMRFGQRLWIVPSGMDIPPDPSNIEIRLDPGLAFGTGTHPTTALCLEWLDGRQVDGRLVVDYGCGSGILGIAAALMGAGRVLCIDNDPQALEATRDNAGRNGVADLIACMPPQEYEAENADLVLANILSEPLIELAPVLIGSLAPGGHIVLSGILEEQAEAVAGAYRRHCEDLSARESEGWVRLAGRRRFRNDKGTEV